MEFVYFLGRFHVLVLHLPIGILLLAVVLEVLAHRPRYRALEASLPAVWLAGAISALATVVLGYMHAAEGGFEGSTVNLHRWSGSIVAFLAFLVWAWRSDAYPGFERIWPAAAVAVTASLFATGHYGGKLTHGSTYLVEFAPAPLRALAGVDEELLRRPPVTDLAAADIYLDVVAPAIRSRCTSCHNADKRRGSLSLARYQDILKGGESGPAVVPGDPAHSELIRRIALPVTHVDFMPKDGKTPLGAEERAAIEWWIAIGAPRGGTLAELRATADVRNAIAAALGLEAG